MGNPKITAETIVHLLAEKHAKDVFVPECKDGPTQSRGNCHLRLDAWAMKRSWANPNSYGYEVKVSRSDFLQDEKWRRYLELCTDFYFVCPTGLVAPSEVSAEAGLMWVSKTGTRLYTKKRAPTRDIELPESMYRYILMARSEIVHNGYGAAKTKRERIKEWEAWLEEKEWSSRLGRKISDRIAYHINEVDRENARLRSRMEAYEHFRDELRKMGRDPDRFSSWEAGDAARELRSSIPSWLPRYMKETANQLQAMREWIEEQEAT